MSAAETIRMAEASGIRLGVEGADLILDADVEPPVELVDAIRCHKADIIQLLAPTGDRWTAEDWRVFFEERAGNAEHDGGHVWLHSGCHGEWMARHRAEAVAALAILGLRLQAGKS